MFASVLIANRGEIACRIARTAARLGHAHHRGLFGGRRRRAARAAMRRGPSDRAGAGRRKLSRHRPDDRGGAAVRRAMHSSGLRLSVRERRVRRGLRQGRHRLRRAAAVGDPRHGTEGQRQGADGEGRRAGRAGLSRRAPGAGVPQAEGLRDRLSGADQGGRRRRRQGHAPRRQARRVRGGARSRAARGEQLVRRRARADREICRRAAPYRNAGVCRRARQRHPSQRARLFVAAPPSEGDRGGAGARHDARSCARRWARPR